MKRLLVLLAAAALCGTVPAIAIAQMTMDKNASHITIPMVQQHGSQETGSAGFTQKGNDLIVTVKMTHPTARTQPVHIHKGTCANLDPKPTYPLNNLENGVSTTTIHNLKFSALVASPYAVNVHYSPNKIASYVACGDIVHANKM